MKPISYALFLAAGLVLALALTQSSAADETKGVVPPKPAEPINPAKGEESAKIVLAGGCFWCTEYVFEHVEGVTDVVSGYAGGTSEDADYKKVSAGETDHAEVIEVTYDPAKITLGKIFRVFFGPTHDPTQLNRQGPDYGKQYRSAIFYANDAQKQAAEKYLTLLRESGLYGEKIVTTLEPLDQFYPAEDYHQDYVKNNPENPYVVQYALPKLKKLKQALPELVEKAE